MKRTFDEKVAIRNNLLKDDSENEDTLCKDLITCPHCGDEIVDSWEFDGDGEMECGNCEKLFAYQKEVTVHWTTWKGGLYA